MDTIAELRAEIERLQEAKRRALAIADERSKENAALRAVLSALKLLGEIADVCAYDSLGEICDFCRCPRGKVADAMIADQGDKT